MSIAAIIFTLIILLPGAILVGALIIRRFRTSWMAFAMGALAFLVGQIAFYLIGSLISNLDIYQRLASDTALSIIVTALLVAIVQLAVLYAGYLAAFRYIREQSRTAASALTLSAGFAGGLVALTYGLPLFQPLLQVIQVSQMTAPPEGVTAQQFAEIQSQTQQILNLPLIDTLVLISLLPAITIFVVHFAASMATWIGVIGKKWLWVAAGILWLTALMSGISVVGGWSTLYVANHELYSTNLVIGTAILLLLILISLGVIYVIYRRVAPLLGEAVKGDPTPSPVAAKPALEAPKPADKPARPSAPSKKLKNTDLK